MYKEGKIWGENILLFNNGIVQINQINIKRGGRCSKHLHKNKNNIFYIQSGKLLIEQWNGNFVDKTILINEQSTEIKNNTYHRFTAMEDTIAIEIYYCLIEENDILREDTGCVLE